MDTKSSVQVPEGCCHVLEVLNCSVDQAVKVLGWPTSAVRLSRNTTDNDILRVVAS